MKKSNLLVLAAALFLTACATANTSSQNIEPSSEEPIIESSNDEPSSQQEESSSRGGWSFSWGGSSKTSSKNSEASSKKESESYSVIPSTGFTIKTDLTKTYDIHTTDQNKYLSFSKDYYHITKTDLDGMNATGNKEASTPNGVSIAFDYTPATGKTIKYYGIKYGQKADLSDGYEVQGGTSKNITVYNVFLGNNYFQVLAHYTDGSVEGSDIQIFKVNTQAPRNLKLGNMSNCRDMGGRVTVNGAVLKQGLIYRTCGNKFDKVSQINSEGKALLTDCLKVKTEINVSDSDTYNINLSGTKLVQCKMDYGSSPYSNLSRNAESIRKVYATLADSDNYPCFYHCRIGTDRTGIVGITLDGLLGVSFQDTLQDYGFSNFGNIGGQRYSNKPSDPDGDDCAKYVDEILKMPGVNFQEQCFNALRSIGVPAAHLNAIIDNMTDGKKATFSTDEIFTTADKFTLSGTSLTSGSDYKDPDKYAKVKGSSQSAAAKVTTTAQDYTVVVYLGCTNSSTSTKLASGINLSIDGSKQSIVDVTYQKAGFGVTGQSRRTGYMFEVLGKYSFTAGEHTVAITGANNDTFNVAGIHLIPGTVASYN